MAFENMHRLGADAFLWDRHLELTRNVVVASAKTGDVYSAEGIALTVLAADLLAHELKASVLPSSRS